MKADLWIGPDGVVHSMSGADGRPRLRCGRTYWRPVRCPECGGLARREFTGWFDDALELTWCDSCKDVVA